MGRALGILVFVVAMMAASSARAQVSVWLQKGVSGVGASSGVLFASGQTGLNAEVGYSYLGFLELDLDLGWAHAGGDPDIDGSSIDGLNVGTVLQFHPVKQSKEFPVSIDLQGASRQSFYFSQALDDQGISAAGWQIGLGGGIYRFVPLAPSIGVIPEVDLAWIHSSTTLSMDHMDLLTSTQDDLQIIVGANFAILDSAGHIWGVTPTLGFGTMATTFGLAVNFVLPIER
jgi:hypothetical protein